MRVLARALVLPGLLACGSPEPEPRAPDAPPAERADLFPARVRVRPVFLVTRDADPPTEEQRATLARHLEWCRRRYRELLLDRDTFALAEGPATELRSDRGAEEYLESPGQGSEWALLELFAHDGVDRFTCPYVYVVLLCGTGERPKGGGAPINGGANCGGGIVVLAAENLSADVGFQACLQHEIGHAFGLVHANAHGWDMRTSESLMSYNPAHRTHGFEASATPGKLLPEELRLLDANDRVFPEFTYDPSQDAPPGYAISQIVPLLPQMSIAGQREFVGSWDGK